jgi:tRNA-dihydrouridine synthase B
MRVALAPMAGITDSAFRLMNKLGGADLVYSEMAHVNAISYNSKKTLGMLKASPFEFPYLVQLFGKDPQYFAKAAKIISTQGVPLMEYEPFTKAQLKFIEKIASKKELKAPGFKQFYANLLKFQKFLAKKSNKILVPSGLDINLGCPAKKVFGHGGGAALWKDLGNLRKILESVLNNTNLPVSIKVRTAVGEVTLFDLLDKISDLQIKSVMIHGRSYAQGFTGPIDPKIVNKIIKKYPQFEFWVNGGIVDAASAQKISKQTGCSNLGIARGALGNPLLSSAIKDKKIVQLSIAQSCVLAYIHTALAYQAKGSHGVIEMRKHLAWYFKDFPGAKSLRKQLVIVENIKSIKEILASISKL